jgi:hypothetical protein
MPRVQKSASKLAPVWGDAVTENRKSKIKNQKSHSNRNFAENETHLTIIKYSIHTPGITQPCARTVEILPASFNQGLAPASE